MSHARYGAYKNSGAPWLGDIPAHWSVIRLKDVGKSIIGLTYSPDDVLDSDLNGIFVLRSSNIQEGKLSLLNNVYVDKKISTNLKLRLGDILICSRNGSRNLIGKNICIDERTAGQTFGAFMTVFRSKYFRFIQNFFNSKIFESQSGLYMSSTINQLTVNTLNNFLFTLPPLPEQAAIAAYLDTKTAQLDRQIDLLGQKAAQYGKLKQSIINETVTRGLNKTVAMKDSGVEWIGEVPTHWEVQRIKDITLVKRGASPRPIDDPIFFNEEGEYSWVRIADLSASERYLLNTKEKLSSLGASLSVKRYPGDFILSIAGTVGKPIITRIKCCIHDGFVWFPTLKMNPEFLYYIFSTGLPYQGLGKLGTQLNLNTETVGLISIPLPSASEIENIVAYLDEKTAHIDRIVAVLNTQIVKLRELRKTLINDIVTGKICIFKQETNHE